jgi:hypothetical protein
LGSFCGFDFDIVLVGVSDVSGTGGRASVSNAWVSRWIWHGPMSPDVRLASACPDQWHLVRRTGGH